VSEIDTNNSTAADNIWLTSKTRMRAEKRYKTYSLISHLLLSYYAFLLIVHSIFSNPAATSPSSSQINLALSVAIFGVSIIVYGFNFGETAQLHRDCYLRLQRLLDLVKDEHELLAEYHKILAGYPNHSNDDFEDLIIDRTFVRNTSLRNSKGPIVWTKMILFKKAVRLLIFWAIITLT
jgi:hypothetical protein